MEELSERLGEILQQCRDGGFVLPYHLVAVGTNGSTMLFRATEAHDGLKMTTLIRHEVNGFATPINLMITDATGNAARVVVGGKHGAQALQMLN